MKSEGDDGPMKKGLNVCIVGNSAQSFVARDIEILGRYHNLEFIETPRSKRHWIKTMLSLRNAAKRNDLFICWFAGWHAAFAEILGGGTPVVIIVGGYDAANVPEIDYGAYRNLKERGVTKYSVRHADWICVVDESLKSDLIANTGISGNNLSYIPTAYDQTHFRMDGKKEELVITVGNVTKQVAKRKGYDHFVEAAKSYPEVDFALIGKWKDDYIDKLRSVAPKNVQFTGFVSDDQLLGWYRRAKVYCQLSRYEGLPNALCEAMLCECTPVGTKHCGIPTAIGDTGFYTEYGNVESIVQAIEKALASDAGHGSEARRRIIDKFPIHGRENSLNLLIENITKK